MHETNVTYCVVLILNNTWPKYLLGYFLMTVVLKVFPCHITLFFPLPQLFDSSPVRKCLFVGVRQLVSLNLPSGLSHSKDPTAVTL